MIELIGFKEIKRFGEILLDGYLEDSIIFENDKLQLKVNINGVSEALENHDYNNVLQQIFFMKDDSTDAVKIKGRDYELSYKFGEWGYDVNVPESHISLGCKRYGDFFSQLELSYCLMDKNNVYITKTLSKLAGRGAMSRLNGSAKSKEEKITRRNELVKLLNMDTLAFEGHEWAVIYKVSKENLFNPDKQNDIFHNFWDSFLRYSFTVEELRI